MDQYEYTKYIATKDTLRDTIANYGVAIIPSVLNDEECQSIVDGLWDYFEHISKKWEVPIQRENQDSWKQIYSLLPLHSMLFQYFNIGHAQICWDMRQNEKILDVFAHLWGCTPEDLLVSFDGASFNVPPEITQRGWNRNHNWYHTDQSFTRNDFECVQSWVTGVDVHQGDATLAFLEGSNRFHKEFASHFKITDKSDWFRLSEDETQWYISKGCSPKKIQCPKGSLVFWDSRTIHSGAEALRERKEPNFRAVIYLCYTPRSRATDANLLKKINAFENLRTTNHYPHKPKLFGKAPRTYSQTVPKLHAIYPPGLQPIGFRLAGLPCKPDPISLMLLHRKQFKLYHDDTSSDEDMSK